MARRHFPAALAAALGLALSGAAAFAAGTAPGSTMMSRAASAFPTRDGPFSAIAVFVAQADLKEFDKPAEQGPRIAPLKAVKAGEPIALKILFDHPKTDDTDAIDITYDLKFTEPGGKVGSDQKDLVALRGKVQGADSLVFDNRIAVVTLAFDAKDKPGAYTADIVLHDNNAKRSVPLKAQIELKP